MGTRDESMEDVSDSVPERSRGPRLFIREMVMRNFKSYAGEQRVGPFHKVRVFDLNQFSPDFVSVVEFLYL